MATKKEDCIKLHDVGDILYRVSKGRKDSEYKIEEITIIKVEAYPHYVYRDNTGHSYFNHSIIKSCFKTKEEAEQEVQRRKNITKKHQMLREYERELNKKLNLEGHYTIK